MRLVAESRGCGASARQCEVEAFSGDGVGVQHAQAVCSDLFAANAGVGKRKALADDAHERVLERIEKLKASIRAKVEHAFHVVKNLFKMRKVRYRGLAKNTAQLYTLFGMANLVLVKRRLFELGTLNPS